MHIARAEQRQEIMGYLSKHTISQFVGERELEHLAVLVERYGCYNAAIRLAKKHDIPEFTTNQDFYHQYSLTCYRLNVNLDPDSSINNTFLGPSLIRYILLEHVKKFSPKTIQDSLGVSQTISEDILRALLRAPATDPTYLAYMRSEELMPGSVDHILEEIRKRSKQKIKARTTAMFRCPNCSERKCTYVTEQKRGLDEPETYHITCAACEYDWYKNF